MGELNSLWLNANTFYVLKTTHLARLWSLIINILCLHLTDLITPEDTFFICVQTLFSLLFARMFPLHWGNSQIILKEKNKHIQLICRTRHSVIAHSLHHSIWNKIVQWFCICIENFYSLCNVAAWVADRNLKSKGWRLRKNKENIKHHIGLHWKGKCQRT